MDDKAEEKEYLQRMRHSCSHVLAQAVAELFPGTKLGIGPTIKNGFYYDFDCPHNFTPEDLPVIEAKMAEIIKQDHPFVSSEHPKAEAEKFFDKKEEKFKVELIRELPGPTATYYQHGEFTDLCRGPHVESTGKIKHFKLLHVSGAYWRGRETNPAMQRIYGTAFSTLKDLQSYLNQIEEARKRDHRKLGLELGLFSVHEEAGAGLIHWHPKGATIRYTIETYLRRLLEKEGYKFVYTPHISSEKLYQMSGHIENYSQLMYAPMDIEGQAFRIKPMNCPNHILIYNSALHSYRELPIKMAEFGTVYRFERSGVLHGLLRVRGFTQDDSHIFCTPDQFSKEVGKLIKLAGQLFRDFGFEDVRHFLATRPEKFVGETSLWDEAERGLKEALESEGFKYEIDNGGGAFYGPKIDQKVTDAIGREWQLCTIQVDFNLPRRFNVKYRARSGKDEYAVMIHRALLGSLERFIGLLIEHFAGAFPLWLSPVQVKVLTITSLEEEYARSVVQALSDAGIRTELDTRSEKIGLKVRDATLEKVPYMLVLGKKESSARMVSLRLRGGKNIYGLTLETVIKDLVREISERSIKTVYGE